MSDRLERTIALRERAASRARRRAEEVVTARRMLVAGDDVAEIAARLGVSRDVARQRMREAQHG